jgi:hypothetical protein
MIKIVPRAAIPTTTIDQPTINHLKNSDNRDPFILKTKFQMSKSKFQINVKCLNVKASSFGVLDII